MAKNLAKQMQQSYIICGHIHYDEGETVSFGIEVTLVNEQTGELQFVLTNEKGKYLFDCLNFEEGYQEGNKFNVTCTYGHQEVIIDMQYAGIQCPINKPSDIPVEPIVAGTALVAAAGGLYYYIKRKNK